MYETDILKLSLAKVSIDSVSRGGSTGNLGRREVELDLEPSRTTHEIDSVNNHAENSPALLRRRALGQRHKLCRHLRRPDLLLAHHEATP